jgi:hypothetical protein
MNRRPWITITLAFVLAVSAIRWGRSYFPPQNVTRLKWELFMARKDEVDLLFLGGSEVFNGFDPESFDRRVAESGLRIRSFNMGIPLLNVLEERELLLRILREKPPNLKYLFLEPILDKDAHLKSNPPAHVSDFHSWGQLVTAARLIMSSDQALSSRLKGVGDHALGFAYDLLNVGHLSPSNLHFGFEVVARVKSNPSGHLTVAETDPYWFREASREYEEQKASFESMSGSSRWGSFEEVEFLQQMASAARDAGLHTYFVGLPTVRPERFYPFAQAVGQGRIQQPFLGFRDPIAQSGLNAIGLRWKGQHLNQEGSRRFSEALADQFTSLGPGRH